MTATPLWPAGSRAEELIQGARRANLGVLTPSGPHTTPVAVAWHGGRLWAVTPRRALKARSLRDVPSAAALIETDGGSVTLGGTGLLIDPLRPSRHLLPLLLPSGLAGARYLSLHTADTSRIARDALRDLVHHLDPGGLAPRALIAVRPEWAVIFDDGNEVERWGALPLVTTLGRTSLRAQHHADLRTLPAPARDLCDRRGPASLTVRVGAVPLVLPCQWEGHQGSVTFDPGAFALLPSAHGSLPACVTLPGTDGTGLAAKSGVLLRGALDPPHHGIRTARLHIDRALWWRGRDIARTSPAQPQAGEERRVD